MKAKKEFLQLGSDSETSLIASARDTRPVSGLTHNFYRYPARFSPMFVRQAIETFTCPGDLVLDPHAGGGTTLVEALALGRHAVGIDISELAEFVSSVKTTIYKKSDLERVRAWSQRLHTVTNMRRSSNSSHRYRQAGYYKHLDHPSRWRLRKTIELALDSTKHFESIRLQNFARCIVLRTAQWALDGRKTLPSVTEFREMLEVNSCEMIASALEFRNSIHRYSEAPKVLVLNRSAVGMETEKRLSHRPAPRLVLTSPPYPGVHILYHRWQVDGRKETAAPFWIANKLDGLGSAHYTMGDRKSVGLRSYFDNLYRAFRSIVAICDPNTIVVQVVAFSDQEWQLSKYLEVVGAAGFSELFLRSLARNNDGRLWRSVPNRRWYADQRGETSGSREVVLFHKTGDRSARMDAREKLFSVISPLA